jgi:hypothetical protein
MMMMSMTDPNTETSCPSSSSSSLYPCGVGNDLFRRKEREIKAFLKAKQQQLSENKYKKQKLWKDHNSTSIAELSFLWEDVVDPRHSGDKLLLKQTLSSCCCDSCNCHSETNMYEIPSGPPGLFIFKNALCSEQQFFWAKKALEDYSTVEHTNLTNLSKLQSAGDPEVGPKTVEMQNIEPDLNNLWQRSLAEKDNFASFNKLRWSCLGYHYGELFSLVYYYLLIVLDRLDKENVPEKPKI